MIREIVIPVRISGETVGILYNKNVVSQEDLDKEGWNILCDEKYKGDLYMYDSERDSFIDRPESAGVFHEHKKS